MVMSANVPTIPDPLVGPDKLPSVPSIVPLDLLFTQKNFPPFFR